MEMEVDEVGPSLRYATAKVQKVPRGGGGGGGGRSGGGPVDDPWATAAPAGAGGRSGGFDEQPPF